jgi:hypothetical protein
MKESAVLEHQPRCLDCGKLIERKEYTVSARQDGTTNFWHFCSSACMIVWLNSHEEEI